MTGNKMNQLLGGLIKLIFVLQIIVVSLNSYAQKSVNGFQIHDDSGFFEIKDQDTGANIFSEITAGFSYDGKLYRLKDLVSESRIVSETNSTFGKGERLTWKLLVPSKKMRFALELISYPENKWLTVNGWVQNLNNQKITLNAIGLRIAAMQGGKANLVKRTDGLWDLNVSGLKDEVAILLRER